MSGTRYINLAVEKKDITETITSQRSITEIAIPTVIHMARAILRRTMSLS